MKKILLSIICIANYFCSNAQVNMFHENFETPDSVTAASNDPASTWGLNNRIQTDGTFSDSASLTNCDTITLTTSSFSTVGYSEVVLSFKHICKINFFDKATIEASADGGLTWVQLGNEYLGSAPFQLQLNSFSSASYGDWFPGNPALTPTNTWWKTEAFDLTTLFYNVPNAQIRFVLIDENCDATTTEGGWFIDDIVVTDNYFFYYSITGKLFTDLNSNQIQDAGEPSITNYPVTETTGHNLVFSHINGSYSLNIADTGNGNFTVFPQALNYYNVVPGTSNAYVSASNEIDSLNDFAFQPAGVFNDLCVTISPIGNFRANMDASYRINYQNLGTTALSGTVILFPDNDITYVSSSIAPASVTTDSVIWNVGTLTPFQTGSILVTIHVNLGTSIGTLINSNVLIEPVAGDANTACNYNAYEIAVTGSVDPNAILVDRASVLTTELSSPPYLNYIIWFQNTGNDTAFNVRIKNIIPENLDINSFEYVASSFPSNITYYTSLREMNFEFNNILLPDSNVNEPASHGFVRYRIKPLSTLIAGDLIENSAAIYFDFNLPVLTNTAMTEIVLPTEVGQGTIDNGQWIIYPNPVTNELIVRNTKEADKTKYEITISDITGRINLRIQNSALPAKLDVSKFAAGIYFLIINDGNSFARTKVVKQ